jgi:hypothetical protein
LEADDSPTNWVLEADDSPTKKFQGVKQRDFVAAVQ